jgi:hypothetical protein
LNREIFLPMAVGVILALSITLVLFSDFDRDGVNNLREFSFGTNIFNPDSDGDGLLDGLELIYGTDPLAGDSDGDGLPDGAEVKICGTNPLVTDSDDDGIIDGEEVNRYQTDPLLWDSDGDGLGDGLEVKSWGTNPLSADSDGDGLSDGEEVNGSWHLFALQQMEVEELDPSLHWRLEHRIWTGQGFQTFYTWSGSSWSWPYDSENILRGGRPVLYTSDPLLIDSDGDGLTDNLEHLIGTDPRNKDTDNDGLDDLSEFHLYQTIPVFYDTDGDLLGDGEESLLLTDPLRWDSDGDRLSDGIEVKGYDVDGDGLTDVNFPSYGANPLIRDIFVEVDWMPGARTLGDYSRMKLSEAFARHNLVLHLDQGELGGGGETEEQLDELYDSRPGPMNDLTDFREKYFTPSRRGTFFWCLITLGKIYVGNTEVGGFNHGDIFTVAGTWSTEGSLGSAFMHELGHALGLNRELFDGIDSRKYPFEVYRSVMNYNAPYHKGGEFFDYSDGAPFNDWEHLNFNFLRGRIKPDLPPESYRFLPRR